MNISINKNTESFFGLTTLIPGTIWFLAGYISHVEANSISVLPSISSIAFICLLASVIVALFLTNEKGSKTLQENQTRYKNQTSNWQNEKHLPEIVQKLENHMKLNEPFMDSSLSVYDLANQINVPSRELSITINHNLNKHFFDYVNEYRIKKAMHLFQQTTDEKLTVLEVLYDVGFNSKSSFNTAFKKFTGKTPSEYRKSA
jgi:AraC-like DNA-binding protein